MQKHPNDKKARHKDGRELTVYKSNARPGFYIDSNDLETHYKKEDLTFL